MIPYVPDQFEIDAARVAGRHWEKWPRSFISFARRERYPIRMWRTFAAILFVGQGRPRFRCKLKEIAEAAGQCRRTTQLALRELEIDNWIEREFWKLPGSKYNGWTKYTVVHLVPAY